MTDPTARLTAEVTFTEHVVDLTVTGAPAMTFGSRAVTPVGLRVAYEDSDVTMIRIEGRGPSGFVDYYPLNDPADWPAWLSVLAEEHRPAAPTAAEPDGDELVRCGHSHCPNGERFRSAAERGWVAGPMGSWACPQHAAVSAPGGER